MRHDGSLFDFEMPDGRSWEECLDLCAPFAADLFEIVMGGIEDYKRETTEFFRARVEAKDRGACTTSLIYDRGKVCLLGDRSVSFCNALGIRKFIIGNACVLRVKTCGEKLLVLPGKSPQHEAWYLNEPILGFPNHLTRLNLVYQMSLGFELRSVFLTWQVSPSTLGYRKQLFQAGFDNGSTQSSVPIDPRGPLPIIPIIQRGSKEKEARKEGR